MSKKEPTPLDVSGMSNDEAIAHTANELKKLQEAYATLNTEVEELKRKMVQLELDDLVN